MGQPTEGAIIAVGLKVVNLFLSCFLFENLLFWTDGRVDGRTDELTDGRTDGQVGGR